MPLKAAIEHRKGKALGHRQITQAFRQDDLISQTAEFVLEKGHIVVV
jgi:hypothetical protein